MPKRVTFALPGISNRRSQSDAIEAASEQLSAHSIDGSVSIDFRGAAFPRTEEDITDVMEMSIVCEDDYFDQDLVNTVHAFLVAEFTVPDGATIHTDVEDIDERIVG